jgi:hypothetical protein
MVGVGKPEWLASMIKTIAAKEKCATEADDKSGSHCGVETTIKGKKFQRVICSD